MVVRVSGTSRFDFGNSERLWAVVGFIILLSIIVHGVTAAPLMERLARRRQAEAEAAAFPEGAAPANPPASKDGD